MCVSFIHSSLILDWVYHHLTDVCWSRIIIPLKTIFFFSSLEFSAFCFLFLSIIPFKNCLLSLLRNWIVDLVEGHMQRVYYNVNSVSIVSCTPKHTWTYTKSIERFRIVSKLAVMWMDASSGCIGCEANASESSGLINSFPTTSCIIKERFYRKRALPSSIASTVVYGACVCYFKLPVWIEFVFSTSYLIAQGKFDIKLFIVEYARSDVDCYTLRQRRIMFQVQRKCAGMGQNVFYSPTNNFLESPRKSRRREKKIYNWKQYEDGSRSTFVPSLISTKGHTIRAKSSIRNFNILFASFHLHEYVSASAVVRRTAAMWKLQRIRR